jgi:hypothetical protein
MGVLGLRWTLKPLTTLTTLKSANSGNDSFEKIVSALLQFPRILRHLRFQRPTSIVPA